MKKILTALLQIPRWIILGMIYLYWILGMTYPIHETQRYIECRPGDALLLSLLTFIAIAVVAPLTMLAWALGGISTSNLVGALMVLFALPPLLTFTILELLMFYYGRDKK